MKSITVKTTQELKKAIKGGYDEIIVPEDLGKKITRAKNVKKLSPAVIGALVAIGAVEVGVTAVAPPVGALMAKPAIATGIAVAGLDIAVIALISGVGLMALSMLWDDYAEVDIGNGFFAFKRKRSPKGKNKNDDSDNNPQL